MCGITIYPSLAPNDFWSSFTKPWVLLKGGQFSCLKSVFFFSLLPDDAVKLPMLNIIIGVSLDSKLEAAKQVQEGLLQVARCGEDSGESSVYPRS